MKKKRFRGIFSGARGQRFFNILYSIGASIVILGALFKLLHLHRAADPMLIIGMGTEALIFFLSAFDEQQMGTASAYEEAESHGTGSKFQEQSPEFQIKGTEFQVQTDGVLNPETLNCSNMSQMANKPETFLEASAATEEYVKRLTELNDSLTELQKSLSHNLQGLNAMYELQLRDAGTQLDSVNKVHRETEQMTETIKQLNAIYERMLAAMQTK